MSLLLGIAGSGGERGGVGSGALSDPTGSRLSILCSNFSNSQSSGSTQLEYEELTKT